MRIILSCGHKVDSFEDEYTVAVKEWTREDTRAIAYKSVCGKCRREYRQNNQILDTMADEQEWLHEQEK